jgi:hypothetical protein
MPTAKTLVVLVFVAWFALAERLPSDNPVTVHEWGTFTSVTRLDGRAAVWAPLQGPGDLPCFVERLGRGNYKLFYGMVRMETPVLYFYARSPLTLSVKVDFPKGWVTEWFPRASAVTPRAPDAVSPGNGSIAWDKVEVLPHSSPNLWTTQGASHYFAARNTDAAPVRIGGQWEKLIFYRGVGNFQPPLLPVYQADGSLVVTNKRTEPIAAAILFENRNGRLAYSVARNIKEAVNFDPPKAIDALDPLLAELKGSLVEFGLYRKEAEAMVATWRDSWFEPGSRIFYIMPRAQVDELLPLQIAPAPSAVSRVFVGRAELLAPWVREAIGAGQGKVFGRFTAPFMQEMTRTADQLPRPIISAAWEGNAPYCVQ